MVTEGFLWGGWAEEEGGGLRVFVADMVYAWSVRLKGRKRGKKTKNRKQKDMVD